MKEPTLHIAQGRWREILPAFGVPVAFLSGKHQACPLCGGKDRARFTDLKGAGDYFCNQCGSGPGVRLVMKLRGWDFAQAAREIDSLLGRLPAAKPDGNGVAKPSTSPAELNGIWQAARLISPEDAVGRYFAKRGIGLAGFDLRALRFVPALMHHPSKSAHPGMIARVSDANGRPRQIHRTYLSADGHKARVSPPRMFMSGELPSGGAIRLGPIAPAMGVAEGIETALSASLLQGLPVWATTSAGMLERWRPPPEAARILIFGDNDDNYIGQAAAFGLAKRLVSEAERDKLARRIEVWLPPESFKDWNDVLCERAASA